MTGPAGLSRDNFTTHSFFHRNLHNDRIHPPSFSAYSFQHLVVVWSIIWISCERSDLIAVIYNHTPKRAAGDNPAALFLYPSPFTNQHADTETMTMPLPYISLAPVHPLGSLTANQVEEMALSARTFWLWWWLVVCSRGDPAAL